MRTCERRGIVDGRGPALMRFAVETWAPEYGAPVDDAVLGDTAAQVDLAAEVPLADWAPVTPDRPPVVRVLFVDGVQRIDARVWVTDDDGLGHLGVCASWAAGVVCCDGRAQVIDIEVRRGVLVPGLGTDPGPITTGHGSYGPYPVPEVGDDPVGQALGRQRGELEGRVAARARRPRPHPGPDRTGGPGRAGDPRRPGGPGRAGNSGGAGDSDRRDGTGDPGHAGDLGLAGVHRYAGGDAEPRVPGGPGGGADSDVPGDPDELLVVDGPLGGVRHVPGTVGYVKAHHVSYLQPAQQLVVGGLRPGQRTPLFTVGDDRFRWSWYLRLPGPATHPWWGVVRCEAAGEADVAAAAALADRVTATLPRFASQPHKDARAPQNLHPIAGLERELRRRLGDALLLERALRRAAGT